MYYEPSAKFKQMSVNSEREESLRIASRIEALFESTRDDHIARQNVNRGLQAVEVILGLLEKNS